MFFKLKHCLLMHGIIPPEWWGRGESDEASRKFVVMSSFQGGEWGRVWWGDKKKFRPVESTMDDMYFLVSYSAYLHVLHFTMAQLFSHVSYDFVMLHLPVTFMCSVEFREPLDRLNIFVLI